MIIDPEEHEVTALLERLPPVEGCRIVEIGCGDGRVTRRYYGARVGSVLAIDPDADAIAAFRAHGIPPNVEARVLAMDQLGLPEASVDAVLFSWAL